MVRWFGKSQASVHALSAKVSAVIANVLAEWYEHDALRCPSSMVHADAKGTAHFPKCVEYRCQEVAQLGGLSTKNSNNGAHECLSHGISTMREHATWRNPVANTSDI